MIEDAVVVPVIDHSMMAYTFFLQIAFVGSVVTLLMRFFGRSR